jgi:hypothetical protein
MNKSIPAFSILRNEENSEEINRVANWWNKKNEFIIFFECEYGYMSFDGKFFYITEDAYNTTITIYQFREYFSVKQPIAYRFNDTNSEFEVIYNKSIQSIIIPTEIAIRAGFEPIYESPLESFAKKHNLSSEAVTELEQLIKKL